MTNAVLIDAAEVAQILDVSKAFAYKVVRELNEELKAIPHKDCACIAQSDFSSDCTTRT